MVRKAKFIPTGPSKLSQILSHLNAPPKLTLSSLKSLKLTLAFRNDHFGARHFVKEQLPRIRFANPMLDIRVEKVRKSAQDAWRPEMELHFANGSHKTLDMHEKWSTEILKELMEVAGGDSWSRWKSEAASGGLPLVPGEENENQVVKRSPFQLPSLKDFLASRPPAAAPGSEPSTKDAEVTSGAPLGTNQLKVPIPPQVPKTGVSAAIP